METNHDLREQLVNTMSQMKLPWESTPEDFFILVFMMCSASNQHLLRSPESESLTPEFCAELEKFSVGFMQMYDVDLSPYTSFTDLMMNGNYHDRMGEICEKSIGTLKEMVAMEEITESGEIQLSPETQQKMVVDDLVADVLTKRMQMFFSFKE